MTKADFRALRETIGLTQGDVADACGVALRTVKRWEHPDWPEPPDDAWEWLLDMLERHDDMVDYMVDKVTGIAAERGLPETVAITYYRDQAQYDACCREPGPYGFANAIAREVALELAGEGIDTEFRYPDSGAILVRGGGDGAGVDVDLMDKLQTGRDPDAL